MTSALEHLRTLHQQQLIADAQRAKQEQERQQNEKAAAEARRQREAEVLESCGNLIHSLGVEETLQELNDKVLHNKGNIIKAEGFFPHTYTRRSGGWDNDYEYDETVYYPISLLALVWGRQLGTRNNILYYHVGVVSTMQEDKVFWKYMTDVEGSRQPPYLEHGSWFCSSRYSKDNHSYSVAAYTNLELAREAVVNQITSYFFYATKGYVDYNRI